ncbi:MAG: putative hydroxymethylpyrimidine transporter CytX [Clostridiaceae bacterium]
MNNENKLSFFNLSFLWFGAAISIAEIITGGFISPLGMKIGIIAILLGHFIGTYILSLGGVIGFREKIPAITSTRMSFGLYGTYFFSVLNILQLLGWTAIMIRAASSSLNAISTSLWKINNTTLWCVVVGILICIWLSYGFKGFKRINQLAVVLLFFLTLILAYIIFKNPDILSLRGEGTMSFGSALELSVVMPLSWLPLISDYTRFSKGEKEGFYGSFLGYFIGSSWMFIIGLGAALISQNTDPTYMMLAYNLGIFAFFIVLLSTITTTFLDAYSAAVSFLNIRPKGKEKNIAIIITIIGTIISIIFPLENYEYFLYAIGSLFSPLFAIVILDYFVLKTTEIKKDLIVNIDAVIVWIMGIIIYYMFIKLDLIFGATFPSMIITGIIYYLVRRYKKSWIIMKN